MRAKMPAAPAGPVVPERPAFAYPDWPALARARDLAGASHAARMVVHGVAGHVLRALAAGERPATLARWIAEDVTPHLARGVEALHEIPEPSTPAAADFLRIAAAYFAALGTPSSSATQLLAIIAFGNMRFWSCWDRGNLQATQATAAFASLIDAWFLRLRDDLLQMRRDFALGVWRTAWGRPMRDLDGLGIWA